MSFLKQSIATLGTQIVLIFTAVGTGVIVARWLGPELKGQLALLGSLTEILFMCASFGFGSAFSFYIAKKRYPTSHIMTLALVSALLFGVLVNGLFYLTWPLHSAIWNGAPLTLVILSTALAVISIYSNYLLKIVVGRGKIYSMNISGLIKAIVNFFLACLFIVVWHMGLYGAIYAVFLAALAQLVVLIVVLKKDIWPDFSWHAGFLRTTLSYGVKSHALLLINFLNYRLDIFLLQYLTGDSSKVGYYSLAVSIAEMMWMVPNSVVPSLFSSVAQSDNDDRSITTLRTCRWSLVFLILLAALGVVLGRLFIEILYGAEYLPTFSPFLLLLPGICLFPLFKLLTIDLAARGFPGYGSITSLLALVVNVGANILLIPKYGGEGAALATSFSYMLMAGISTVFFIRVSGHSLREIVNFDPVEIEWINNKFGLCKKGT